MNLIGTDISNGAAHRRNEALRKMGMPGQAAMTFELSDNLRRIVEDEIRNRHPDWGDGLFRKAYGKGGAG